MTGYVRRVLPADIAVFAGRFASQRLVFAHLLDLAPELDLDHVEVIEPGRAKTRLAPYFDPSQTVRLSQEVGKDESLVLILPSAYATMDCPVTGSELFHPLGMWRGQIVRLEPPS